MVWNLGCVWLVSAPHGTTTAALPGVQFGRWTFGRFRHKKMNYRQLVTPQHAAIAETNQTRAKTAAWCERQQNAPLIPRRIWSRCNSCACLLVYTANINNRSECPVCPFLFFKISLCPMCPVCNADSRFRVLCLWSGITVCVRMV